MVIEQKIDKRKLRFMKNKSIINGGYQLTLEEFKRFLEVCGMKYTKRGFYAMAYKGFPIWIC